MEDFEKKVSISEPESSTMEIQVDEEEKGSKTNNASNTVIELLCKFLAVQQRRALAYARLKRGFEDYMVSGGELAYQKLYSEITVEFNDCLKQVLELESLFVSPDCCRGSS